MSQNVRLAVLSLAAYAAAQQAGTYTPGPPKSTVATLFHSGGCVSANTSIVLDSNYRWLHSVGSYTNCVNRGSNTTPRPDVETCALEGVDYPATLLNQEITIDMGVSKVPCGINRALYLSEISPIAGANALNAAGAKYGTGYCDARCPKQNFVNGGAANCNLSKLEHIRFLLQRNGPMGGKRRRGSSHSSCNITGPYKCSGPLCGSGSAHRNGVCDEDGCDYNPYRMGSHHGPNITVDASRGFTVVTIPHQRQHHHGDTERDPPPLHPGWKGGMVLVFNIWDDSGSGMLWLDGTYPTTPSASAPGVARGPCPTTPGNPADPMVEYPDAVVTFSNIKTNDIGSTFAATNQTMTLRYRDLNRRARY
ncbi:glycoside hydrolase family 7 protein [Cenococcum geophilum]